MLFFYGTWEASGEFSGAGIVVCFACPHTAKWQQGSVVFPVHSLSAQALTCKELVNSQFLPEQLCGKAASLSKLILSYVQTVSPFGRERRWNFCG